MPVGFHNEACVCDVGYWTEVPGRVLPFLMGRMKSRLTLVYEKSSVRKQVHHVNMCHACCPLVLYPHSQPDSCHARKQ